MKHEIWRPILGYEGMYEVSSLGNVRSVDRSISHNFYENHKAKLKGRLLKQGLDGRYLSVVLSKHGKHETLKVHRLVAKAFCVQTDSNDIVNHKSGNKLDNSVENLEWISHKDNSIHALRNGLSKLPPPQEEISVLQFDSAGIVINEYNSIKSASDATGIFAGDISRVCKGKRKFAGGFFWRYKEAV